MRYTLTYCPELGMFRLQDPFGGDKLLTPSELRESIGGNEVLGQWVVFAMSHPNIKCDYDMLPACASTRFELPVEEEVARQVKVSMEKKDEVYNGKKTGEIVFHVMEEGHTGLFRGCPLGRGSSESRALVDFCNRANADDDKLNLRPNELVVVSFEDTTDPSDKARFQHDCSRCVFLGQYNEFDLYVCPSPKPHLSTVLARFGDEGSEYQSGIAFVGVLDELTEAARRAVTAGLLDASMKTGRAGGGTIQNNL